MPAGSKSPPSVGRRDAGTAGIAAAITPGVDPAQDRREQAVGNAGVIRSAAPVHVVGRPPCSGGELADPVRRLGGSRPLRPHPLCRLAAADPRSPSKGHVRDGNPVRPSPPSTPIMARHVRPDRAGSRGPTACRRPHVRVRRRYTS